MNGKVKHRYFYIFLFLLFICKICHGIIVKTSNGLIDGEISYTIPEKNVYYSFRRIPFAKPPVGELRFQSPQPIEDWEGVLSTKTDPPRCIQTKNKNVILGEEDCLYLNVYTPRLLNETQLLPVLVWIYGGAFIAGTSQYDDAAPDYFLDQGIVFVSINYRLGILGFMSLNDLIVPGNNGLKDQNMALKWVRDNIQNFGGDANHVTIFGQSAGAASVSYHLQSKISNGLFSGAIMDSGASLCPWSLTRLAPQAAKEVASSFNIVTNSSQLIVDGLCQIEARELHKRAMEIQNKILLANNPRNGFVFAPVREPEHDGSFFTGISHDMLKRGEFSNVPILVGYNSLEASFPFPDIFRLFLLQFDLNPSKLVPQDMNIKFTTVKDAVGKEIKFHYFGLLPIALSSSNVITFISDDQFVRPIQQFALLTSKYTNTFFYEFYHEGTLGGLVNRTIPGVAHCEELGYIFRKEIEANKNDRYMSKIMVKLWSNFIKFRNPTPEPDILLKNQTWSPISPNDKDMNYLKIDVELESSVNPKRSSFSFWKNLYEEYGEPPYDTY